MIFYLSLGHLLVVDPFENVLKAVSLMRLPMIAKDRVHSREWETDRRISSDQKCSFCVSVLCHLILEYDFRQTE